MHKVLAATEEEHLQSAVCRIIFSNSLMKLVKGQQVSQQEVPNHIHYLTVQIMAKTNVSTLSH